MFAFNSIACIAKFADVVFVVDSSGSIGRPNFEKIKEFIKNVVLTFDVDYRYTRVGLIEFSTTPSIEFKLNEKTNITDLIDAIDNITYSGGGTSTSDALELMRIEGFDRYVYTGTWQTNVSRKSCVRITRSFVYGDPKSICARDSFECIEQNCHCFPN